MGGQFSGPLDVGGAKIVNLPALKIGNADFHQLVDDDGLAVDDAWKAARKDELCAAYAQATPDILITEAFPFGRRQMRFELDPLLSLAHSAKHRPLIVCSVRDILKSERKPGRAEETVKTIAEYYDFVLVHGDPGFARLEENSLYRNRRAASNGIEAHREKRRPCLGWRWRRWRSVIPGRARSSRDEPAFGSSVALACGAECSRRRVRGNPPRRTRWRCRGTLQRRFQISSFGLRSIGLASGIQYRCGHIDG